MLGEEQASGRPRAVRAVLADGSVVTIRPLCSDDLGELERLHGELTEEDRYFRFFGFPSRTGLDRFLRGLVAVGDAHLLALGAFRGDHLVGIGHFETLVGEVAEVAFLVEHRLHARGVATLLLEHLVAAARQRGIRMFLAEVLAENSAMLRVLLDSGLRCSTRLDGTTYQVKLDLDVGEQYFSRLSDRERVADVASLRWLLHPASVAVVGASRRTSAVGDAVLRNIVDGGYTGAAYAVNRRGGQVCGLRAYRSVIDLPEPPELAVLCVPAGVVPDVAEECGRSGVRALVVLAAGLTEDRGLAERLLEAVRHWGMRLLGPNCLGLINADPEVQLNATFAATGIPAGQVGVATQSGGVGIAVLEGLSALGLGISALVSTGDKYDVSGNDMLLWWERDEATRVGVLYLESFGNPRKFAWLARRTSRIKPLIVLRSGASPVAQKAAASHTAATATPGTTRDALLRQTGVIGVDDLAELLAVLAVVCWQAVPSGRRVAVVTNAGGLGVLTADACARAGLEFPSLHEDTCARLAATLPGHASLSNPVDATATVDSDTFARTVATVLGDPSIDSVVVPVVRTAVSDPAEGLAEMVAREREGGCDKPVLVVRGGQAESVAALEADNARVPAFADPSLAARALADLAEYAYWLARPPGIVPDFADVDTAAARALIDEALEKLPGGGWLDPEPVAAVLRHFGLPVVPTTACTTVTEALAAFRELGGCVVVKVRAAGVLHKAHAGGVVLGVSTVAELRGAWAQLQGRFGAAFGGVVLQPSVEPGQEFLVGVIDEAAFGPVVTFGLGGTDTDLIADRSHRLVPLTDHDAADMLHELRAAPQLFGDARLDSGKLIDVLLRTARMAEVLPEIAEVDLNPVIASERGVCVPDARVRLEPREPVDPLIRKLRA